MEMCFVYAVEVHLLGVWRHAQGNQDKSQGTEQGDSLPTNGSQW